MALLVLLVCLGTYRLTRLAVTDNVPLGHDDDGEPDSRIRLAIRRRYGDDSWQTYLSTCPWCVGVYVGGAVTLATDRLVHGGLVAPALVWAAAATITGMISTWEPA